MTWTWNNDYSDLEQVAEFYPAYLARYEELRAGGQYPYNDSFKGRIPSIEGPREDTAIYLLQGLRRQREMNTRLTGWLADGFEPVGSLGATEKFSRVILYRADRSGEWHEYADARLVPETNPRQAEITGGIAALLPKGKRTHGVYVGTGNYAVLVKA